MLAGIADVLRIDLLTGLTLSIVFKALAWVVSKWPSTSFWQVTP